MKRRLVLAGGSIAVLVITSLFVLWYFPGLTFRMVSVADGPHNWSQRWQTILGFSVTENMASYPSEDEARNAFENQIARAETILQRTKNLNGLPDVEKQVVGTFILSTGRRYSIVRLQKKAVYQTYAPSLRYALAFAKFRDRHR
jgi:hypothetical protein